LNSFTTGDSSFTWNPSSQNSVPNITTTIDPNVNTGPQMGPPGFTPAAPYYDPNLSSTMSVNSPTDQAFQQNMQAIGQVVGTGIQAASFIGVTVLTDGAGAIADATAENVFYHYTQAEIPVGQGLSAGAGVTSVGNLNASEAMFQLGIDPPTYVYPVRLSNPADYLIQDVGIPARNQLPAWQVIRTTPPGSVGSPMPVPPRP
jgi:hypothetical protein